MADSLKLSRLRRLLDYDPATGIFTWRVDGRGRFMRVGARAGTIKKKRGHRQICIDQVIYMSGPLAWFYMTGRWSRRLINHINGKPADDRWSNLREADHSQNAATSRKQQRKKPKLVPFKGVTWDRLRGQYQAAIKVNYRMMHLGRFDRSEAAHAAYCAAAKKYFGEFARTY
jgi:hypothetical protein